MWMCYVQEVEITDLKSGVRHLLQKFKNLQFDAEHEAVYGMGSILSEDECRDIGEKYGKGVTICELFLKGTVCESCLVNELLDVELDSFLYRISHYLAPEQRLKFIFDNKMDTNIEKDEDKSEGSAAKGEDNLEDPRSPT